MKYNEFKKAVEFLEMKLYARMLEDVANKADDATIETDSYRWFTARHIRDSLIAVEDIHLQAYLIGYVHKARNNRKSAGENVTPYNIEMRKAFNNQYKVAVALYKLAYMDDSTEYINLIGGKCFM